MFAVEPAGSVAVLRMDDGRVNVMTPTFARGFVPAFRDAAKGVRAVVLAGNARAFGAGLDLEALAAMDHAEVAAFARAFTDVFRVVAEHPRPVVAAVDGPAIAGGAVLALVADFRVATPATRIGVTAVPVGLPYPAPFVALLRARLPASELPEATLLGTVRRGEACVRSGWADRFVARGEAVPAAIELAVRLDAHAPLAYEMAKRFLLEDAHASFAAFEQGDGAEAWADLVVRPETRDALRRAMERLRERASNREDTTS